MFLPFFNFSTVAKVRTFPKWDSNVPYSFLIVTKTGQKCKKKIGIGQKIYLLKTFDSSASLTLVWLIWLPHYDALPVALVECVSSITFCILAFFFTTGFLLGSWSTLLFAGGFLLGNGLLRTQLLSFLRLYSLKFK